MNPESADALQEAFLEFEKGEGAAVAVFWGDGGAFCAGLDLKHTAALEGDPARGAIGPSRLELYKPVISPH